MELTSKQRAHLRGLAHHVDPTVQIGDRGVSSAVVAKVVAELESHELIKVKLGDTDVKAKDVAPILAEQSGAAVVQVIGKVVVLYKRRAKKPSIELPG
ncbi:MAG: ribosome assembly RNA-binding protein YhbY [Alphaproteobacteria bacterium]|nr:ribosome assembly RNA-binding protein YhbY [Alphaproteobacteria bacterium]